MIDVSASQPYKKLYLVELNLAGSLIAVRDVQFAKAPALIVSDEAVSSAKSTVSRAVQPKNADVEIMFTDPEITAFLRAVQPENASVPISVYPSGMVTPVIISLSLKASPTSVIVYLVPANSASVGKIISPPFPL